MSCSPNIDGNAGNVKRHRVKCAIPKELMAKFRILHRPTYKFNPGFSFTLLQLVASAGKLT